MVSEWMVNGNITEFIKMHRDANRFELVGSHSRIDPPFTDEITLGSSKALPRGCCICTAKGWYMET